jgi:hypothetical protein
VPTKRPTSNLISGQRSISSSSISSTANINFKLITTLRRRKVPTHSNDLPIKMLRRISRCSTGALPVASAIVESTTIVSTANDTADYSRFLPLPNKKRKKPKPQRKKKYLSLVSKRMRKQMNHGERNLLQHPIVQNWILLPTIRIKIPA